MLENILDNYKEYIFSNPNDINFIYNYKIKYITIPKENILSDKKFKTIIDSQNFIDLLNYLEGNIINKEAEDLHARIVQHEFDHLNGILYTKRLAHKDAFGFEQEIETYWKENDKKENK